MSDGRPVPDAASQAASRDVGRGDDDGLLASIGKAITAPILGAAEPEEPKCDGLVVTGAPQ